MGGQPSGRRALPPQFINSGETIDNKSARILLPLRPNCAASFADFLRPAMVFDRPQPLFTIFFGPVCNSYADRQQCHVID